MCATIEPMHTEPRTLGDLNARHARTKALDRFFDVMARAAGAVSAFQTSTKAAVPGLTSGNDPALSEPFGAFAGLVAAASGFGQLLPLTLQGSPGLPIPGATSDPTATWVGEGHPIAVGRGTFARVTLAPHGLGTIFVCSNELLRTNDPRTRALLTRQAARQLGRALDVKLFGTDAASDTSPAGLLAAAPPLGGGSPADLGRDLAELFAFVSDGHPGTPVLILSPRVALYLAALNESLFRSVGITGGTIGGIPVIASPGAGHAIILLDADRLATYDGAVAAEPSEVASVEMSDAPTNSAASGTGSTMVSLFQTSSAAVKLVQTCDWQLLADDAVAYVAVSELGVSPA